MTDPLLELSERIIAFRDERDWRQFHNPKDLALALGIEAAELSELFLWKSKEQIDEMADAPAAREGIADELADTLIYTILLAHHFDIDLVQAASAKLAKNAGKYPVDRSKGNARKYTEFER